MPFNVQRCICWYLALCFPPIMFKGAFIDTWYCALSTYNAQRCIHWYLILSPFHLLCSKVHSLIFDIEPFPAIISKGAFIDIWYYALSTYYVQRCIHWYLIFRYPFHLLWSRINQTSQHQITSKRVNTLTSVAYQKEDKHANFLTQSNLFKNLWPKVEVLVVFNHPSPNASPKL